MSIMKRLQFLIIMVMSAAVTSNAHSSVNIYGLFDASQQQNNSNDSYPPDSIALINNDTSYNNPIRSKKSLSVNINLALGSIIILDFSVGKQLTKDIEVRLSFFRMAALLAYEAVGFSVEGHYYLPPRDNYQPFVSFGAGPLWELEGDKIYIGGGIVSGQFGWDYVFDSGMNMFLAVGLTLSFVRDHPMGAAGVQIGIGYRF